MLCPAMSFTSGRVFATAGAAQAAAQIQQGCGFLADGSLAIDTNAPAASAVRVAGIARNATGALHGTTTVAASDVFLGGLRFSADGQLVYEAGAPTQVTSGNPLTATGALAIGP